MRKAYIGTSGFMYKHWKDGVFYPEGLPQKEWFKFYTEQFTTVELNVSYYRLPKKKTFENWWKESPQNFTFAVKGSRYIVQQKKLKNVQEPLQRFFQEAEGLREKLSIVLWQFPPNFSLNLERLERFCFLLSINPIASKVRHAFEFRHQSWFVDDVYKLLMKYNLSLCVADSPLWPKAEIVTADYIYIRFHGGKKLYSSEYTKDELKEWAKKIKSWQSKGVLIFAYFNNDAFGFAPQNAKELINLLF